MERISRERMPVHLILTGGGFATDGGSLLLETLDEQRERIELRLDWSFQAQQNGVGQLYAQNVAVPRGSEEEGIWLSLVQEADIHITSLVDADREEETLLSNGRAALGQDINALFATMDQGPVQALRWLSDRLHAIVSSDFYQHPRMTIPPPEKSVAARRQILSLLTQGKRIEAMKVYREAYPETGLKAAKEAIEAIIAREFPSQRT